MNFEKIASRVASQQEKSMKTADKIIEAIKFDTRKEIQKYRQEHDITPGTKLQIRTPSEKKERNKEREGRIAGRMVESYLTLTDADKRVLDAFTDGRAGESRVLSTDGKVLDGLWMGGKELAFRDAGGNITPGEGRPHVKSDEVILRALKKITPSRFFKAGTFLDELRYAVSVAEGQIPAYRSAVSILFWVERAVGLLFNKRALLTKQIGAENYAKVKKVFDEFNKAWAEVSKAEAEIDKAKEVVFEISRKNPDLRDILKPLPNQF